MPTISPLGSKVLREDNRAIVRASSAASKAADYLLVFRPEETQVEAAQLIDASEEGA
jgi:antirestriction protein ArdC